LEDKYGFSTVANLMGLYALNFFLKLADDYGALEKISAFS